MKRRRRIGKPSNANCTTIYYPADLYTIAFLQNDAADMKQQVMQSAGQAGVEDTLLANESDTVPYYGRLRESEDLTRRAMESAERTGKKEKAATFFCYVWNKGSPVS